MVFTHNFTDEIQGDTFLGCSFTIVVNDTPLDLSNCQISAVFETSARNGKIVLTTNNNDIQITDALNGVFHINAFSLKDKPMGTYKYDITITFPDNKVRTYVQGVLDVSKGYEP